MKWFIGLLVCSMVTSSFAADEQQLPGGDEAVAYINGEPFTLRQLENELLRKEGVETLEKLIHEQLQGVRWDKLEDRDVLLAVGGWQIPRVGLAAKLLEEQGGAVREEMIAQLIVRQRLKKENIHITGEVLQREFERHDKTLQAKLKAAEKPSITLKNYIEADGKTVESYMAEEGFRLGAGLHELVHKLVEVRDEKLKEYFARHSDLFEVAEALEVSVIHFPFVEGDVTVDDNIKERRRIAARQIFRDVETGKTEFAKAWQWWTKGFDPAAGAGGHQGWVRKNGQTEHEGRRHLPARLMDLAFTEVERRTLEAGPLLLAPFEHDGGIDIVRIEGHRSARNPGFKQLHDKIQWHYIEDHLEQLTKITMTRIRKEAKVDRKSFAQLVIKRRGEADAFLNELSEVKRNAEAPANVAEQPQKDEAPVADSSTDK